MEQAQKAEEKGQDVEEVIANVSEATLRHQKTLATVWEKVPEPAQKVIEKVIEASKKGYEQAIEAIKSPEKRQEIIERAKGVKAILKEKIEGFQKTLEEGLEKFEGGEVPANREGGKMKTLDTERLEKEGEKILPTPELLD
jgi:predicted patatin/cPLA2 family phospholipase